jgi:hypothetical protein
MDFSKIEKNLTISQNDILLTLNEAPDIISEDILYQNIQEFHRNYDDFIDGDLSERIEEYEFYKLIEIDFNKLDLEEWNVDESLVEEIKEEIEFNINTMPLCVIDDNYSIIDGIHRLNALKNLGYNSIKVYQGIRND